MPIFAPTSTARRPRRQRSSQELTLRTISVSLKATITQDVNGKRAIVNSIANLAKNRDQPHQRRVRVTVKKAAQKPGKLRLRARSIGNNAL